MSRAIQRLMKDYRKAEKLVGRTNEPLVDLASAATITSQTMAQIRREPELTQDEKKYLVAVERGDMATTRRYLDISTNSSLTLFEGDLSMTPININCLDPLGRSALLIAIEYENIEMIELLLSYNVDTTEALLFAIDEQFVEAVELLLQHEDQRQHQLQQQQLLQQQQSRSNLIDETSSRYPNNSPISNEKSNQLFTLAQDALEKERHDVSHKVNKSREKTDFSFF